MFRAFRVARLARRRLDRPSRRALASRPGRPPWRRQGPLSSAHIRAVADHVVGAFRGAAPISPPRGASAGRGATGAARAGNRRRAGRRRRPRSSWQSAASVCRGCATERSFASWAITLAWVSGGGGAAAATWSPACDAPWERCTASGAVRRLSGVAWPTSACRQHPGGERRPHAGEDHSLTTTVMRPSDSAVTRRRMVPLLRPSVVYRLECGGCVRLLNVGSGCKYGPGRASRPGA